MLYLANYSSMVRFRILLLLLLFWQHVAGQEPNDDFTLVKEDENIFIYERWTIFPASNPPVKAREVKGVFHVKSRIDDAVKLIQDERKIYDWQKHVSEFKVYLKTDTSWWEEYSYHDIPWPVSDQDHFLEYRVDPTSTSKNVFITFKTKVNHKLAPVRENVNRMVLSGSWRIEEVDRNKIRVTYSILSMPGNIPRMFTDPVIRNNMMSTIKHYISILEGAGK
jgi:hypothetical protein